MMRFFLLFSFFLFSCTSLPNIEAPMMTDASEPQEALHEETSSQEAAFGSESAYCMSQPEDESICHPLHVPKVDVPTSVTAKESNSLDLKEEWSLALPPDCSPTNHCCYHAGCLCSLPAGFPFRLVFSHPPKTPSRFLYQLNNGDVREYHHLDLLIKEMTDTSLMDSELYGRNYSRFRFKLVWDSSYAVGAEFYHKGKEWTGSGFCGLGKIDILINVPSEYRR